MNYLYPNQYYPGMYPQLLGQASEPMTPYFPMTGFPDIFAEEKQVFEDARRLQSFFPRVAQEIQQHVEEECDKMEYEGSMMFDEYPDRIMLSRLTGKIAEKMKDFSAEEALRMPETASGMEDGISMQSLGNKARSQSRNWMEDLIQVVLLEEMHRRRCRHRRCRNRRFW